MANTVYKKVALTLDADTYDILKQAATADRRAFSNFVECLLIKFAEEEIVGKA